MLKRKWLTVGFAALTGLAVSGCEANEANKANKAVVQSEVYSPLPESVEAARAEQLLAENAKLRSTLEAYEQNAKQGEEAANEWKRIYPEVAVFSDSPHEWASISILSEGDEVTLTDPALLDYASRLFAIEGLAEFTNGIPTDIDPFTLRLMDTNGHNYLLNMSNSEAVEFPELAPGWSFRVSPEIANIGKGWMKRPWYIPEESLSSRLLNSGTMLVGIEGKSYYFAQTYRVRRLAIEFLQADKKKVEQPKDSLGELALKRLSIGTVKKPK